MSILLTGGTGFIGSHTAVELMQQGYDVIIADNLYNSEASVIDRIEQIVGRRPTFYEVDVSERSALEAIFQAHAINAVIHFAGYKAVGESVRIPLLYYRNNLDAALTVLEVMQRYDCHNFIFSSSATVYSREAEVPYREDDPHLGCSNPYGWTKFMIEQIARDAASANKELSVMLLRYFNPIGAHESGLIGEKPNGIPNNLMPYITQVAAGIRDHLSVFGNDYPTHDGTGVRDYIHVTDLAKGHVAAYVYCLQHTGCEAINLGTGVGYSVLDIVHAFEEANHLKLPYEFAPRRAGDLASYYASPEKAKNLLGWHAEKSLQDMCRDSWKWQQNPCAK